MIALHDIGFLLSYELRKAGLRLIKRHGHARLGAIVPFMFQTGQCSQGAKPYLTARTAVGILSINILSVPQALLSVNKKEAFTSLFFHFVIQESLV